MTTERRGDLVAGPWKGPGERRDEVKLYLAGACLGAWLGFVLLLLLVLQISRHNARPAVVERRARAAYTRWAERLSWHEGDRRLDPWERLQESERERWRLPLRIDAGL